MIKALIYRFKIWRRSPFKRAIIHEWSDRNRLHLTSHQLHEVLAIIDNA